VGRAPSLRVIP